MTTLKRVMVSLPRDLEAAVEKLKRTPELRNVPVSQIFDLCGENGQSNIPLMRRQERTFPI